MAKPFLQILFFHNPFFFSFFILYLSFTILFSSSLYPFFSHHSCFAVSLHTFSLFMASSTTNPTKDELEFIFNIDKLLGITFYQTIGRKIPGQYLQLDSIISDIIYFIDRSLDPINIYGRLKRKLSGFSGIIIYKICTLKSIERFIWT